MPKLPQVQRWLSPQSKWKSATGAAFVASFLQHTQPVINGKPLHSYNHAYTFAAAVRHWFDEQPAIRQQFIEWYESIPSVDKTR